MWIRCDKIHTKNETINKHTQKIKYKTRVMLKKLIFYLKISFFIILYIK